MPLSPAQWHARYAQQASWTSQLRRYLFDRSGIRGARAVLDCGCGTGALESSADFPTDIPGFVIGLDIDSEYLDYAKLIGARGNWVQADGLHIPFAENTFDIVFCHFLLLWVADPLHVLREMERVTCPSGTVLVLAEPDYGGRIDFPPELEILANWQEASLRSQGANPNLGRRLGWMLHQVGLDQIETGVLGAQWSGLPSDDELASEWQVLQSDLELMLGPGQDAPWQTEYEKLKRLDRTAWQNGERVLYVPTFYACGKKALKQESKPDSNVVKF
jgi:SAM-dependent methyltransferase